VTGPVFLTCLQAGVVCPWVFRKRVSGSPPPLSSSPTPLRLMAPTFMAGMYGSSKARDITKLTPEELAADLGLGPVASAIDVLVGGPACQAFARVGRSKLREIRTLILGKSKVSSNVKRVVEVGRRRAGTTF